MKNLFIVVHRCARSVEETITNSGPRSSRAVARERFIGAKIKFTVRREFFNGLRNAAGCRHQRHRPIRRAPVDRRGKKAQSPKKFLSPDWAPPGRGKDLKRRLYSAPGGVCGLSRRFRRKKTILICL